MTDTPGTLEERARRIVARFYQGIRDHDYAHWVMKGYKDSTNDMRLVVTALTEAADEIASLRARVEAAESAARSSHDVVELMRQTIEKLDARLREKETKNER